jgi:hypothetical protein
MKILVLCFILACPFTAPAFRFLSVSASVRLPDNRHNELTIQDQRLFKGLGSVPTPIPVEGDRLRLPAGYRLFLRSFVKR